MRGWTGNVQCGGGTIDVEVCFSHTLSIFALILKEGLQAAYQHEICGGIM